jgi:hypothetical protein
MKTIKTYLPCFTGFYATLFADIIDQAEENIIDDEGILYDEVTFKSKEFMTDISKECVGVFEDAFNRDMKVKLSVCFESLFSPKFYNFENDSINVAICLSDEDFDTIISTLKENREEVSEQLKERYLSREGFSSFHSTDFDTWIEDLTNENELSHKFGAILEILCEVLDIIDEEEMVDKVRGNVSLDYELI